MKCREIETDPAERLPRVDVVNFGTPILLADGRGPLVVTRETAADSIVLLWLSDGELERFAREARVIRLEGEFVYSRLTGDKP